MENWNVVEVDKVLRWESRKARKKEREVVTCVSRGQKPEAVVARL